MQTFTRLGVPLIMARTRWMFGFHRRLVRRWEWEMELPQDGPLPQISQLAATAQLLRERVNDFGDEGPVRSAQVAKRTRDQRRLAKSPDPQDRMGRAGAQIASLGP